MYWKFLWATWSNNVANSTDVICRHFAKGCVEIGGNWVVMLYLCTVSMVGGVDGGLSLIHSGHTPSLYF